MTKNLLLNITGILLLCFVSGNSFAQQLNSSGDVISSGKSSPNNILAYTPCSVISGSPGVTNQKICNGLTNGSSTITAFGGFPSYFYTWFQTQSFTPINLPANTSTYTSAQARGYWFTSPTNTIITGLRVPTDIGTSNQFIYLVKWGSTPPTFPTTASNYTVLGKYLDVPGLDTVKCGIPIYTGDIIGVLGVRGTTAVASSTMSYAPGGFVASISGFTTTLYRFMDQTDITTNNIGPLCEGGIGSLARVEMFFGNSISLTQSATNLSAGNYSCFYTDSSGCLGSSTITIAPGASITATSSFTNPTCSAGNNGLAMVTPTAGFAPYTYSWSPIGGTSNPATNLTVGNYSCVITDNNGNCATSTVTLSICTGIKELNKNNSISIYPNPSNGKFIIQCESSCDILIINSLGCIVHKEFIHSGNNNINISMCVYSL